MNITNIVPLLILLTIIPAMYGAFVKLSSRILRYEGITWKNGFLFGLKNIGVKYRDQNTDYSNISGNFDLPPISNRINKCI